jgi:diguanylate cyclase (GGDEF)-like protein/PAS domain S-box-containing protein
VSPPPISTAIARLGHVTVAAIVGAAALLIAVLLAWTLGWTCDLPTVLTAVAVICGGVAVRMLVLAYTRHTAGRTCRSTGLLGLGLLVIAATCAVAAAAEAYRFSLMVGGLVAANALFIPAQLQMPGFATGFVNRARHVLDGMSVGICLLFACWVLVIAPRGRIESPGFWIAVLAACTLSMPVVTALRASVARHAVLACSAAVAATVIGLSGLVVCVARSITTGWPLFFGAIMVVAPVLALYGSLLAPAIEAPAPTEMRPVGPGYPILIIPAATAVAVAVHRLIVGDSFDRPALLLGMIGVGAVAVRESLAARDAARYARRVVQQDAQFRSLIAGSSDVIMVLDADLIVRWQSAAAARQFGLSDQEVVGRHFQSMVHPDDAVYVADRLAGVCAGDSRESPALIEARLRDGFGQWRETESSAADQRAVPEVAGIVVHVRDVSERKEMERAMHRLAFADQLTGLANRRQMLLSIVAARSAPRVRGALLLIELDGFNAVNDVRGYDTGDAVLVEVARRLKAGTAETDLPARLGGDEFAVVTDTSAVHAYALATRLLMMLAEPIVLPSVTVYLTASIGMADLAGGSNVDDVLRRADLALRQAKRLGRGRVEWYDAEVEEAMLRRMTLEQDLPGALERGELDLIYQPIIDLVESRPRAVEALLRWRHPRLGTLLPADVIPVAQDVGLSHEIGGWVLHQSGRQLAGWLNEGRDLSMAVNVSPDQLESSRLAEDIGTMLDVHELPADRLVLEVAEPGLGPDPARIEDQLMQVRSLGVRTALDDFGTGPESLTHLRSLPMDMVKIGRTFYDESPARPGMSVPIIEVMVGLGRRLGLEVVAQGLEAAAHLDVVRAAGCRLGQGHLLARPQPAERTEAYLDGFPPRK